MKLEKMQQVLLLVFKNANKLNPIVAIWFMLVIFITLSPLPISAEEQLFETNNMNITKEIDLMLIEDEFWKKRDSSFKENNEVVYIISCLKEGKGSEPRSIGRVLGIDDEGILYIGKASSVGRLADLLLSIRPGNNGKNHAFGVRYKQQSDFEDLFPRTDLSIQLLSTPNATALEKECLSKYFKKFGELPPFNRAK